MEKSLTSDIDLLYFSNKQLSKKYNKTHENKEINKLVFIEVQTGTYFGEDDIVRVEDDYNRK